MKVSMGKASNVILLLFLISDILVLRILQDEHHGFQSQPVMTTHHLCLQSSDFLQTFYILSLLLHTLPKQKEYGLNYQ